MADFINDWKEIRKALFLNSPRGRFIFYLISLKILLSATTYYSHHFLEANLANVVSVFSGSSTLHAIWVTIFVVGYFQRETPRCVRS